jgi:hypothetical protein
MMSNCQSLYCDDWGSLLVLDSCMNQVPYEGLVGKEVCRLHRMIQKHSLKRVLTKRQILDGDPCRSM